VSLAVAAAITWLGAFAMVAGQWLPLVLAIALAIVTAVGLRLPMARLKSTGLLAASALTLLALQVWLGSSGSGGPQMKHEFGWPFGWFRAQAIAVASAINPDAKALTLGLGIGDSSLASRQLLQDMKTVSLTHLVAVSGANCAIVVAAVYFALRRCSIRFRVFASLLALLGYVLLVGPSASVLRAAVMAAVVLLAQLSGRKSNPVSILALSVIVLVVASPELSIGYSFALSVAATFGILVLAPGLHRRLSERLPSPVALALAVSISSQLLCFPILLQLQQGIPTYSVLANLICEPLVAPITVLSIVAVLLSGVPWLASPLFWLASLPAAIIAATAHWLANLPLATAPWFSGIFSTLVAVLLVVSAIVWLNSRSTQIKMFAAIISIASLVFSISSVTNSFVQLATWPQSDWQIANCDVGQGDAAVLRSSGQIAVIDVGRSEPKIDSCLSRLGVSQIDLLVLTHFDFDHVGGLAGAIRHRRVISTMLTPFVDDRPAAQIARELVKGSESRVIYAEQGLQGKLGQVTWRVLSPSRTASEAEDSNDGSVTMLFKFDDFSLISLADLGEKGQMRLAENLRDWYDPWVASHDLVMKVSHHGSADQYQELLEYLHPAVALVSVGRDNGYGHPTRRTLSVLERVGSLICRTDLLGAIAISRANSKFAIADSGAS
jgi:competence protein ComEC